MQSLTRWLLGACLLTGRGGGTAKTGPSDAQTQVSMDFLAKIDLKATGLASLTMRTRVAQSWLEWNGAKVLSRMIMVVQIAERF